MRFEFQQIVCLKFTIEVRDDDLYVYISFWAVGLAKLHEMCILILEEMESWVIVICRVDIACPSAAKIVSKMGTPMRRSTIAK